MEPTEIQSRLATKMLEEREKRGLTQKQVADALGISEGQYAHYEKCRAKPDINVIYELSQLYNASMDAWLGIKKPAPIEGDGFEDDTIALAKKMATMSQDELDTLETITDLVLRLRDKQ